MTSFPCLPESNSHLLVKYSIVEVGSSCSEKSHYTLNKIKIIIYSSKKYSPIQDLMDSIVILLHVKAWKVPGITFSASPTLPHHNLLNSHLNISRLCLLISIPTVISLLLLPWFSQLRHCITFNYKLNFPFEPHISRLLFNLKTCYAVNPESNTLSASISLAFNIRGKHVSLFLEIFSHKWQNQV